MKTQMVEKVWYSVYSLALCLIKMLYLVMQTFSLGQRRVT